MVWLGVDERAKVVTDEDGREINEESVEKDGGVKRGTCQMMRRDVGREKIVSQ